MSPNPQAVFDLASQLTETERAELAFQILETLPFPERIPSIHDEGFLEELERRAADREPGMTWEQVRDAE